MFRRRAFGRLAILLLLPLALLRAPGVAAAEPSEPAAEPVRAALAAALSAPLGVTVDGTVLLAASLRAAYEARDFRPIWIGQDGPLATADTLRQVLAHADQEGLEPRDYQPDSIAQRWRAASPARLAELELLLSDALMRYGADVRRGRIKPRLYDPKLFVVPRDVDQVKLLQAAAETDDLSRFLTALPPPQATYAHLRLALAHLRKLAARRGWPALPQGPSLKLGMHDPRVAALRARLAATRDLPADASGAAQNFDAELETAVKHFQARHGLDVDGVVGPKTRAAMNVPVEARIEQIIVNMERWRWLPDDLGDHHIMVNLAAFELELVEHGERVLRSRVVVGRPYRQTPMFSSTVTHVVLNPYWYVPRRIAAIDLLPKIQDDPAFLHNQGFAVFASWADGAPQVAPDTVEWQRLTRANMPYRLRQDPGPKNALGRFKFELPNPFSVYLHDTPTIELFEKSDRAFSSGCIRVQRAAELADLLLRGAPGWNASTIAAALAEGKTKWIRVPDPPAIHLVYMTAWLADDATVQFRNDIYGRDLRLRQALQSRAERRIQASSTND